jgi:hypothetical protein
MDSPLRAGARRCYAAMTRWPTMLAIALAAGAVMAGSSARAAPFPISSFSDSFSNVTPNPTAGASSITLVGSLPMNQVTPASPISPFSAATSADLSVNFVTGNHWSYDIFGILHGNATVGDLTVSDSGGSEVIFHFAPNAVVVGPTPQSGFIKASLASTSTVGPDFVGYLGDFIPGSQLQLTFSGFSLVPNASTDGFAVIGGTSLQVGYSFFGESVITNITPVPEPATFVLGLGGLLLVGVPAAVRHYRRK